MAKVHWETGYDAYEMPEKYAKETAVSITEYQPEDDTRPMLASPKSYCNPDDWPVQPTRLDLTRWEAFCLNLYDVVLFILALALIAKTSLCIYAYNRDGDVPGELASWLSKSLVYVNDQMTTLFTVIFIAIVATTIRRYTLWKAQYGAYVSDLEQLQSSISLTGTIKMVFILRKFTLTSFALVVLWSFFYLGSQASKREYALTSSEPSRAIKAAFPSRQALYPFNATQSYVHTQIEEHFQRTFYSADPTESFGPNGMDAQGNALVPLTEYNYRAIALNMESGSVTTDPNMYIRTEAELQQWMKMYPQSGELFSSYEGVRLKLWSHDLNRPWTGGPAWTYTGAPSGEWMDGSYQFSSSVFEIKCSSVHALSEERFPQGGADTMRTSLNVTSTPSASNTGLQKPQTFDLWYRWNERYYQNDTSPVINGANSGALRVECNVTRPTFDGNVICGESGCVVSRMKFLPRSDENFFQTPFEDDRWAFGFFDSFLSSLGKMKNENRPGTEVGEMLNVDGLLDLLQSEPSTTDIENHLTTIGDTLSFQFNTYFNIALNIYLNPSSEDDVSDPDQNPTMYQSTFFYGALFDPKYRLDLVWLIIDYVAGSILVLSSIFSFWLRKRTLAPDIFGFVSSLTRDNPYIPVIQGGSTLSGTDRARAMGKVKIRIADVGMSGEIGKIGIVAVDDVIEHAPLNKHRKYL